MGAAPALSAAAAGGGSGGDLLSAMTSGDWLDPPEPSSQKAKSGGGMKLGSGVPDEKAFLDLLNEPAPPKIQPPPPPAAALSGGGADVNPFARFDMATPAPASTTGVAGPLGGGGIDLLTGSPVQPQRAAPAQVARPWVPPTIDRAPRAPAPELDPLGALGAAPVRHKEEPKSTFFGSKARKQEKKKD
jgi:hypothetical protein